jgi:hypothetical protein
MCVWYTIVHFARAQYRREAVDTTVLPPDKSGQEDMLGDDLATLACNAAIELDDLLQGRSKSLIAVRDLSARLSEEVPDLTDFGSSRSLVDPSTVVALHLAIQDSQITGPTDEISELTRQAGVIVRRLNAVTTDPQGVLDANAESLRQLKTFCLSLSKQSSAAKIAVEEPREPHPYRRQG